VIIVALIGEKSIGKRAFKSAKIFPAIKWVQVLSARDVLFIEQAFPGQEINKGRSFIL
jgi:hypothetical protein